MNYIFYLAFCATCYYRVCSQRDLAILGVIGVSYVIVDFKSFHFSFDCVLLSFIYFAFGVGIPLSLSEEGKKDSPYMKLLEGNKHKSDHHEPAAAHH